MSAEVVKGHCGETTAGQTGHCTVGDKGAWVLKRKDFEDGDRNAAMAACTKRCLSCPRCRYVSLSVTYRDCSWYESCDLTRTTLFADFQSWAPSRGSVQQRTWKARPLINNSRVVAARAALGELHPQKGTWAWFQPTARSSVAVVMYGKVGTLYRPSTYTKDAQADPAVVHLAHATVKRHVLDANPHSLISVFIHSWNPSLKAAFDAAYRPTWSHHQPLESNDGVESASTSLARALRAVKHAERTRGAPFDLLACWRHDLHFSGPMRWEALPRAQLWFVAQCCDSFDPPSVTEWSWAKPAYAALKSECHDDHGSLSDVCGVRGFLSMIGSGKDLPPEAQNNYWVNDWLMVAPSAMAHTFGAIARHRKLYHDLLHLTNIRMPWMHFYWAAHVHHAVGAAAGVRALPVRAMIDVWLPRQGSERMCRTNASVHALLPTRPEPVWNGLQHALCPDRGQIACRWTSPRCLADTPNGDAVRL